jgi:hypothetical protein
MKTNDNDAQSNLGIIGRALDGEAEGLVCDDGILMFRMRARQLSLEVVRSLIAVRQELVGERSDVYCLIDLRGVIGVDEAARRESTNPNNRRVAILYDSPVGRMIALASHAHMKPRYEFELFTDESEALEWLRQCMKDDANA